MHATAAPAVTPHAHRRPQKTACLAWRIARTILAALGILFLVFMVLGLTLGSRNTANTRPVPTVTAIVRVPGPTVTVKPFTVWANHAVVNVNDHPAAGG